MKNLANKRILLILTIVMITILTGCNSQKQIPYISNTLVEKDTVSISEEKLIILPQKSIIIFPNVFKGLDLNLPTQIIQNENTEFKVQKNGYDLNIEFHSDSIISTNKTTDNVKVKIERIEVPVEIEVPVKNKLNWYLLTYSISASLFILRKPIWSLVKKIIIPLPI